MKKPVKIIATVLVAAAIAVGTAGCHTHVTVHSNPGGITHTTSSP
jgi:hypothetical protein